MISQELLKKVGGVVTGSTAPTKPTPAPTPDNTLDVSKLKNDGSLSVISAPTPAKNKTNTLDLSQLDLSKGTVKPKASPEAQQAIDTGKADPITKSDVPFKQPTFQDDLESIKGNLNIGTSETFRISAAGIKTLKNRIEAQVKAQPEIWAAGLIATHPDQKEQIDKIIAQKFAESLANNDSVDTMLDELEKGYARSTESSQDALATLKAQKGLDFTQVSFLDKVAQAAPSMVPLLAVSLLSGGGADIAAGAGYLRTAGVLASAAEILPTVGEATQQAQSDYEQQLSEGKSPEEALKVFDSSLAFNTALLAISNKFSGIWKVENYKGLYDLTKTALEEGAQEAGQQIYSNVLDKKNWWEDVSDNFLIGAILGGTTKGATSIGGVNLQESNMDNGEFHIIPADQSATKITLDKLKEQINNSDAPQEKKDQALEFLETDSEQKKGEILQNALENGSVQQFTNQIQDNNAQRDAQLNEFNQIYQEQISQGVSPQTIYQEISDRTGIPTEEISQAIQEFQTRPENIDLPSQIAKELADEHSKNTEISENKTTPEDQMKTLADEVVKQHINESPEVVKGMQNDAEHQADWENNYRIDYGDLVTQETYLRGQDQRLVQGAAKARVQQQIRQVEGKKKALQEEFKKNNGEVTKKDVEKAMEEKSPKKANRTLNQVGKKKTLKTTKSGVRVSRVENVEKPTKRQLEKRAKAEGTFLDIKKEPTDLDTLTSEDIDNITDHNTIKIDVIDSNPFETTIKSNGEYFTFRTDEFQEFVGKTDPEDLRYFIKGDTVYLIDSAYGDWNVNSIVGRVFSFTQQTETLFQRSSKSRFANEADVRRAFERLEILKDIRVEKVSEILTPQGRQAYGSYFNGLIKYVENPKYGTLPHEAFHATIDLVFTPEQRADLFSLARQEMRRDSYVNPSDIEVEEYLAEKFETYYQQTENQSLFKTWFDKIAEFFKHILGGKKSIENYFNSVLDYRTGQMLLPNANMTPIEDFITELNPRDIQDAREIVNEAEITREEKNFLQNILDNPAYKTQKDLDALKEEIGIRTLQVKGQLAKTEIRNEYAKRGNEEIGLDKDTPSFYFALTTDLEHGQDLPHGIAPEVKNGVAWASVADNGSLHVKEIQKVSGRNLIPDLKNSNATEQEKAELKDIHQNYVDFLVVMLKDQAALQGKTIYFPTAEKAHRVNPQASPETIEKVYDVQMKQALDKFTDYSTVEDNEGGSYVIYPTEVERLVATRFQKGDAFEIAQQNNLTTKILNRLGERKTVSKTFIADLTKMPDVKKVEKDLITEVLKGEPNTINVEEFKQKVRAELLPLYTNVVGGSSNGVSRSARYAGINLPEKLKVETKNYQEKVYESPVETTSGNVHFRDKSKSYFGHTRIEDVVGKMDRRVLEVQSDLYQRDRSDDSIERPFEVQQLKSLEAFKRLYDKAIEDGKSPEWAFNQIKFASSKFLDMINSPYEMEQRIEFLKKEYKTEIETYEREVKQIGQYNNPTAHFRMVREEINQAAKDGKKNILFPTGETAMKIEGLGQDSVLWHRLTSDGKYINGEEGWLKPENLKVGERVLQGINDEWVVTDVLGDGKFKAVPKQKWDDMDAGVFLYSQEEKRLNELWSKNQTTLTQAEKAEIDALFAKADQLKESFQFNREIPDTETFDISGKVDTNNPIYKFYQDTLGKYLKNTYKAELVKDKKGVEWYQIEITPEMAGRVEAFQEKNVFDRLAETFLKIQVEDRKVMKRETAIGRIAEEIGEDLKGGFYTPTQIRTELAKAEQFYQENKEASLEIARGEIPNTTNIVDLAIARYALYRAVQVGAYDDQIKIIQNLSRIARQYGQSISMLRGQLTANSPLQYINQLVQAKVDLAKKKWKPAFKKSESVFIEDVVDSEVKKLKRKKSTKDLKEKLFKEKEFELDSFLESIKC